MTFRRKNNRLEPDGTSREKVGGILPATKDDEVITLGQLTKVVNDTASFAIDPDNAIEVNTPNGVVYIALATRS